MAEPLFQGKTILITGGTGSFGSTVTEHLLRSDPQKIIIFSRDEKKQFDMRNAIHDPRLEFVIGDIRDEQSIRRAMRGVQYVFHAAALKQVPTGEFFPLEFVKTNILGSVNVMQSAIDAGVQRVVVLSTDKAVYPINTMGMTKALMEKVMMSFARNTSDETVICGVRYGNVMYSRGSVIPLIVDQINSNRPLTITHPLMTRFMLPLTQSVDLVLYALTEGKRGDVFVRKAPSCTIETLVNALNQMFGGGHAIHNIGIRSGEKMHETLVSSEEFTHIEDRGEYFRIVPESANLDYERYFTQGVQTFLHEGYTSSNTKQLSLMETFDLLKTLPEVQQELLQHPLTRPSSPLSVSVAADGHASV